MEQEDKQEILETEVQEAEEAAPSAEESATPIPPVDEDASVSAETSKNKWVIPVIAVLAVVLVVVIVIVGFALSGSSDTSDSDEEESSVSDSAAKDEKNPFTTTAKKTTATTKVTTKPTVSNGEKVDYIADRNIYYYDDKNAFTLFFSLQDANYERIAAACTVDIVITNDNGEKVYEKSDIAIAEADFSMWNSPTYGERYMLGIDIPVSQITPGTSKSGTVSFRVDLVETGSYFNNNTLTIIDDLPLKTSTITMPSVPIDISEYDYNDNLERTVIITDVTYKIKDDDLYVYFAGEKTIDEEGPRHSHTAYVSYKLYDSDGYVVESGTFYSPAVCTGDKFRDEEEVIYNCIEPGESYTLEILNTVS